VDGSKSATKEELKSEKSLCKRAVQGDADAFQKLISIDPRYLCSDLGLYFITHWRYGLMDAPLLNTRLDFDQFESHIKRIGSISPTLLRMIKSDLELHANNKRNHNNRAQSDRKNLSLISRSLLESFDGRGLRGVPPRRDIARFYYAASALFSGLKSAVKGDKSGRREKRVETYLQEFPKIPDSQILTIDPPDDLLMYVKAVAFLFLSWVQSHEFRIIDIYVSSPSELAAQFCAKLFGLSERTIQNYGKTKNTHKLLRLQTYPIAKDILRIK
jgi:hypothetical protein